MKYAEPSTVEPDRCPEPKPWSVVDAAYVREQYPTRTAREIAADLGVGTERVSGLIVRRGWRKNGAARAAPMPAPAQSRKKNDLDMGCSACSGAGVPAGRNGGSKPASGPQYAPPDLQHFVRAGSVGDVARALGLSRGTVYRLRDGYWPDDARRILRAWSAYKGRTSRIASSWFLRRVRAGGVVAHAGRDWAGVGLARHVGELVAVARVPDGALLAQTLDLPAERLPLEPRP